MVQTVKFAKCWGFLRFLGVSSPLLVSSIGGYRSALSVLCCLPLRLQPLKISVSRKEKREFSHHLLPTSTVQKDKRKELELQLLLRFLAFASSVPMDRKLSVQRQRLHR
ncbi:hypothetical protein Salat_2920700 [Sesamum alatum]|uniref:Uncharacterized protein n=1 Tax=Sesamum alatum TaxID=300844 RepID=A0AAE1XIU8_9LAMI|nr:hypothetical protein Salat_2920700 [Sesamum alatum]